jgi:hypothetical protein
MVSELAEHIGQSADDAAKNVASPHTAGIVLEGRNHPYQILPQLLTDKARDACGHGCRDC